MNAIATALTANRAASVLRSVRPAVAPVAQHAIQTGYQTIQSVNRLNPEKFELADKATFAKYWDATFLSNKTSEDTFNAIASMSKNATDVAAEEQVRCKMISIK